jgi:hypothetical protein
VQQPTVIFSLAGSGANQYSWMEVTGTATLNGGVLQVDLLDDFLPDPANSDIFQVLISNAGQGAFGTASIDLGNGTSLDVEYLANCVFLVATQP